MSRPPPLPHYPDPSSAPPASGTHRQDAAHPSRALQSSSAAAARGHGAAAAAAWSPPGAPTAVPDESTWPAGSVPFMPMGPAPAAAPLPPASHHHSVGWADSPPAAVPWNVHGPWTHRHPHHAHAPAPTPWFQEARPAPPLPPPPAHWSDPYDAHGSVNVPAHPSWAAARPARFADGGVGTGAKPPAVAERRDGPTFQAPLFPWPTEAPPPPPPSGPDPRAPRDAQWPRVGPPAPPGPARHWHVPVEPRDRDRPIIDVPQLAVPPPPPFTNTRREPALSSEAGPDAPNAPAADEVPRESAAGDDAASQDSTPADAPTGGTAQPRPRPYFVLTRAMYDLMVECVELQAMHGRDAIAAAGRISEITASVGTTMLERRRWKRLLGNLALVEGGPRYARLTWKGSRLVITPEEDWAAIISRAHNGDADPSDHRSVRQTLMVLKRDYELRRSRCGIRKADIDAHCHTCLCYRLVADLDPARDDGNADDADTE
ncbi:hypothetical protein GGF31_001379 [Allomyces arbusculus]|nr:hypothetical protein GGF31_001379 [Allomyces arbusculus]